MSYCHVAAQADQHARDLDAETWRDQIAEHVIADFTWPRLEEVGRALGMCEGDIADALVELRLRRALG